MTREKNRIFPNQCRDYPLVRTEWQTCLKYRSYRLNGLTGEEFVFVLYFSKSRMHAQPSTHSRYLQNEEK